MIKRHSVDIFLHEKIKLTDEISSDKLQNAITVLILQKQGTLCWMNNLRNSNTETN